MGNRDSMISLDGIIGFVLDGDAGETPKFVRDYERKVKGGLVSYTSQTREAGVEKMVVGEDMEKFVEENAGDLWDSICESNRAYMKMGMKLGAGMIFQLLGL